MGLPIVRSSLISKNRCRVIALIVLIAGVRHPAAQAPNPDGAGRGQGVLPRAWQVSGPRCVGTPQFQAHEYNPDLIIVRESGCSNYEKPFLFLMFGQERALLLDTGAGKTDVAQVVTKQIAQWSQPNA